MPSEISGVETGVSEGTLWLSNAKALTCANPTTGAVLASDSIPAQERVSDAIASDRTLYAFDNADLLAITPPANCFG